MATFTPGQTLTLTLDYDDYVTFSGAGNMTVTPYTGSSWQTYLTGNQVIGPFKTQSTTVSIACTSDGTYTQQSQGGASVPSVWNGTNTGFVDPATGMLYTAKPVPLWAKHFYTCDKVVGGKLIDSIGNAHLHQTTNTPKQITNYVSHTANGATGAMVGDKAPDTLGAGKSFFAFAVWADGGAGAFGIQNGAGAIPGHAEFELFRNASFSTPYLWDGTTSYGNTDTTTTASATPTGIGMLYDAVAKQVTFFSVGTDGSTIRTETVATPAFKAQFDPFNANYQGFAGAAGNGIAKLYGFVIGQFTTAPTDYIQACGWMAANWVNGRKDLYPGWDYLS